MTQAPVNTPSPANLVLFSPAGVVTQTQALQRAAKRLQAHGFAVQIDPAARARTQRFAGDDATRLAALHRIADEAPAVALASRGGYGLMRLLDQIDWPRIARSVERGTRWIGYSDLTALQLAALAHDAAGPAQTRLDVGGFWAGPLACDDFGRSAEEGGVDDVTEDCFLEAVRGELEGIGFRERTPIRKVQTAISTTQPATSNGLFDGLETKGRLWGGNLTVLCSLLGTPHWPRIKGGILFLEDVNEHPYRIERNLLQLHQAGILAAQKAVLLGDFSQWRPSPLDRGYSLKSVIDYLRSLCNTPILTGLPHGHSPVKVCLPQGRRVELMVTGRDVWLSW